MLDGYSQHHKLVDEPRRVEYSFVLWQRDDIIVVPEDEGILDMAWIIYEFIVLAIPIKHVHAPGKCNAVMSQVLEELSADRSSDEVSDQPMDPRWSKLLKLKSEE